jgi:hypothetical protein
MLCDEVYIIVQLEDITSVHNTENIVPDNMWEEIQ